MTDLLLERFRIAIRQANPGMGDFSVRTSANAAVTLLRREIASERNAVVFAAAAIARHNLHGEDIAQKIEALKCEMQEVVR